MSLFDCINRSMNDPEVQMDRRLGEEAQEQFIELRDHYMKSMPRPEAEALAAVDTKRIMRERVETKARRRAGQIIALRDGAARIDNAVNWLGRKNPGAGLTQLMTDVDMRGRALKRDYGRRLGAFINRHSANLAGNTRNKAGLHKVQDELFGQSTGDATARALANSIRDLMEDVRLTLNAYGANVGKLENYVPQIWNRQNVRRLGREAFADALMERVDWARMHNPLTGKPFGEGNGSRDFLLNAYDGLTRQREIEPTMVSLGSGARNYEHHRILHFKDAQAWREVSEIYGNPDLFQSIVQYMEMAARDISLSSTFGPNWNGALNYLSQYARNVSLRAGEDVQTRTRKSISLSKAMLTILDGTSSIPAKGHEFFAFFMSGVRNVNVAAKMGFAMVNSIGDVQNMHVAARFLGISRSRMVQELRHMMTSAGREEIRQIVGVSEVAMQTFASDVRYMNDFHGPAVTRKISNAVLRASGLTAFDTHNRNTARLFGMGELSNNATKTFDQLPHNIRTIMKRAGIDADDWNLIRGNDDMFFEMENGARFIIPDMVAHTDSIPFRQRKDLSAKLGTYIEYNAEVSAPMRNLEAQAYVIGESKRGTIIGETARSGLQFKTWAIANMMNHAQRAAEITGSTWGRPNRLWYGLSVAGVLTGFGFIVSWGNDIVKGREPRSLGDPSLLADAVMKGGGLGILADIIFEDHNRYGGSIFSTLGFGGGPTGSLGESIFKATIGNLGDLARGRDANWGRDMFGLVKQNLPYQNMWYLRTALERLLFDHVQIMLDPDAYQNFRQRERRARQDGSPFWWAPGQMLPGG